MKRKLGKDCGFTLIEIFAVVAIVAVCLALFRVTFNYRSDSIKDNVVHEELTLLNCAIEAFKSATGSYPVCAKSMNENAVELYRNLSLQQGDGPGFLSTYHAWKVVDGKLVDPWGNPYVYRCPREDAVSYTLLSMGPNGHIDEKELIDDVYSR
jgi:prepilin-type N-terminal cleavage/methylation domain-containing protein